MPSTYTTNYNFEKPANGDYVDSWDVPVNQNFDDIDTEIKVRADDLVTHEADSTDPHGEVLTQSTIVVNHIAPATGNAIDITNTVGGLDIDGHDSNWYVTSTGDAVFNTITVSGGITLDFMSFVREELLGSDGSGGGNRIFSLSNTYTPGSDNVTVYRNGGIQREGVANDYIETDASTITFTYDVDAADLVTFDIGKTISQMSGFGAIYEGVATPSQTIINLPWEYVVGVNHIDIFIDGDLQLTSDYVETDIDTVTMVSPLSGGAEIIVRRVRDGISSSVHHLQHESGQSDEINLDALECSTAGEGVVFKSPDSTRWKLTVTDAGVVDVNLA